VGILETARSNAITEGLLGGNRRWMVLGGVAWGLRAISYATRREQQVLYRERLRPGEQLVITERPLRPKRRSAKRHKP
jgi:hypothetical protein